MSRATSARTRSRWQLWSTAVGLVLVAVAAAIITTLDRRPASTAAPTLPSSAPALSASSSALPSPPALPAGRGDDRGHAPGDLDGVLTEADGVLPDGVTVFDDGYPGVANLRPELLRALRVAATDAADDGVVFTVTTGWRSAAYQNHLLREAVAQYGSEAEAARWVAAADTSPHVSGEAVDLGGFGATTWLSAHGAGYGLCQIYVNEPWHYELRPQAIGHGCPRMYADPAHDPRMQR